MKNTPIGIMIVDSLALVREGLRCLLSKHEGLSVIAEATDGREAVTLAEKTRPGIVITEMVLPSLSGLQLVRMLSHIDPNPSVVILTSRVSELLLGTALRAGVMGYFLKTEPSTILLDGLLSIGAGKRSFAPSLIPEITNVACDINSPHTKMLSEREVSVLHYLAEGYGPKEIAGKLGLSPKTIESHRDHIRQKTGLRTRHDYIRYATDCRLVEPSLPTAELRSA